MVVGPRHRRRSVGKFAMLESGVTDSPMPDAFVVAAAQPESISDDLVGNVIRHADAVLAARCRLIVFPELSLTGHELEAQPVSLEDSVLAPLIKACRANGSLALVGAPIREQLGDGLVADYIAILAIDGEGARVAYRKMYLGDEEAERFHPGQKPVVIEVEGWRLGLAICKDTGIVEHAAATAALGMDGYLAGVLESVQDTQIPAQRARRIAARHGVWVVISSFAGRTGGGFDQSAVARGSGDPMD